MSPARRARLEHPAIVPIYQAGEDAGRLFLAMRYIAGGTLADRLTGEPLAADATARIIGDVASALDAAHVAGLIHRDVKPGDVLLDGDRALLADFGLAGAAMSPDSLGLGEAFSGTVGYAAPEQIEGDLLTGRTDQYGLACVAFERLAGDVPFRRESELAAIYAHLSDAPPRASCTRRIAALGRRCQCCSADSRRSRRSGSRRVAPSRRRCPPRSRSRWPYRPGGGDVC